MSHPSTYHSADTDVSVKIPAQPCQPSSYKDPEEGVAGRVLVEEENHNPGGEITTEAMGVSEARVYNGDPEDGGIDVIAEAKDIVTTLLNVEDDVSLNPWTFRMFAIGKPEFRLIIPAQTLLTHFIGLGLAVFGSVLQEIYYFKPQTIFVSIIFLTVIAYILGEAMSHAIPRGGILGRILNPHPFNSKEHVAIVIMASAASQCALATEALAVQKLYYGVDFNAAAAVFMILSSQLLGLSLAGFQRRTLVYPTKMLYPINLPLNTLLETLHRDKSETKSRLKVFYIAFTCLFVWEYITPVLTGVSIFCLANRDSLVFTNLFGGSQGNEGLGLLSFCFDWQYIASTGSPLWVPLQTLCNSCVGYVLCTVFFMSLYYSNIWNAQNFPFLSQLLFDPSSNATSYVPYNQTLIFNSKKEIDPAKLKDVGVPWLTATYLGALMANNMGFTATLTHMLLWNYDDIKSGWSFLSIASFKKLFKVSTWQFWQWKTEEHKMSLDRANPLLDPHYKLLLSYSGVPQWWWLALLACTFVIGLACIYELDSTLPWWGYVISILLAAVMILFFGAQMAITGFQFNMQAIVQMIAGYCHPYRPLANMYFTIFGYNSLVQGELLLKDLKLAQFAHLSPRCTFAVQVIGSAVGATFNYIMMLSITDNQAKVLTSIEGSNIWSGQNLQQFNTLAIAWSIASDMFSVGGRYQWVTLSFLFGFVVPLPFWIANRFFPSKVFSYWNLSIILWYTGWLCVGINSSITMYFIFGFGAQWYMRKHHPQLFIEYNYIVSAALDGGTQVIVFILSFAVDGGSGKARNFPLWAGNNGGFGARKNVDYCAFNPANG